jgi:membrane protease YdiL (CAAX protease family)
MFRSYLLKRFGVGLAIVLAVVVAVAIFVLAPTFMEPRL